jgi:predicted lipoprotein with Yx(FWY)xxD motif
MRRVIGIGMVAAFVLAACGGNSNNGSGAGAGGGAGKGVLTVNTANVSGIGTVLVDARGFTLYHLKTETTSNLQCTGSCRSTWPPLLLSSGQPTGGAQVTGTLATFTRPDGGTQVTYDGLTLYTYSGDSGPGQSHGQGIQGVWFAVTPSGLSGSTKPSPTSTYSPGY